MTDLKIFAGNTNLAFAVSPDRGELTQNELLIALLARGGSPKTPFEMRFQILGLAKSRFEYMDWTNTLAGVSDPLQSIYCMDNSRDPYINTPVCFFKEIST